MTAIDDKAVEAAQTEIERFTIVPRKYVVAAIAAADKVRAEGFDLGELKERVSQFNAMRLPGQPPMMHMGTCYLVGDLWKACQNAFAAGLAKGEAERAALREALDAMRNAIIKADIALALAQKDGT